MEGVSVLITDFGGEVCKDLLEFLIAKNAVPYVLVQDFEIIHEVYETFPSSIPIVLDFRHNLESTIDHMIALPTMSCIFNFDDEMFENLYRQNFKNCYKAFATSRDFFDELKLSKEISEAISEGYTLIVNFLSGAVATSTPPPVETLETLLVNAEQAAITPNPSLNSSPSLKFMFERLFFRNPEAMKPETLAIKRKKNNKKRRTNQDRQRSPISELFMKMFIRFNPCSTVSVLNFFPSRARETPIKSPEEINRYIKSQETHEILMALQTIHECALRNWTNICEESFQISPQEFEKRFTTMRKEIERKGEEGRKMLLEKINKDIDRTRQWDHVLGAKTIQRLIITREMEVERKVQIFCLRKTAEAKQKILEEIQENKNRTKGRFYREILDEQIMELMRVKAKYQKRKELLMLPYTGELKLKR